MRLVELESISVTEQGRLDLLGLEEWVSLLRLKVVLEPAMIVEDDPVVELEGNEPVLPPRFLTELACWWPVLRVKTKCCCWGLPLFQVEDVVELLSPCGVVERWL